MGFTKLGSKRSPDFSHAVGCFMHFFKKKNGMRVERLGYESLAGGSAKRRKSKKLDSLNAGIFR